MPKHAPEPWYIEQPWGGFSALRDANGELIFGLSAGEENERLDPETCQASAQRLLSCVNACAGIDDPADLRKQRICSCCKRSFPGDERPDICGACNSALLCVMESLQDDLKTLKKDGVVERIPKDILEENNRLQEQRDELLAALKKAVEVIHTWHGPDVWDIYYAHAPEMKPIREVIARCEGKNQAVETT